MPVVDDLKKLRNVGPATRKDFAVLKIQTVSQLAQCDPDELYSRLQSETGVAQDPCVWDVFAAAIHQARTGEALNWWVFTPVRKARQQNGTFDFR
ncbi:helix-hairpin-helix domain-containing protein [Asticcacaulis sp. W401b]|uniref:helix-hairpin-helix domain-containing protein n=1 Tax=Asticcacaulis sp. W401b TaxID=3388666 RepID=UPI003970D40B